MNPSTASPATSPTPPLPSKSPPASSKPAPSALPSPPSTTIRPANTATAASTSTSPPTPCRSPRSASCWPSIPPFAGPCRPPVPAISTSRPMPRPTPPIASPPDLVDLCMDKLRFARFAESKQLNHPKTCPSSEIQALSFPVFYKKRRGHGSIGSGICFSAGHALAEASASPDVLFQEYVRAPEVTVDAYISRPGGCTVCVPRVRDIVVGGESYTTHTIRDRSE